MKINISFGATFEINDAEIEKQLKETNTSIDGLRFKIREAFKEHIDSELNKVDDDFLTNYTSSCIVTTR